MFLEWADEKYSLAIQILSLIIGGEGGIHLTSVLIEIWGKRACFTRPELKAERVSYDVIPPSAARGILESIYWHPELTYQIQRIYVLNQIQFTNYMVNEIGRKGSTRNALSVMRGHSKEPLSIRSSANHQLRRNRVLKNVRYVIEFTLHSEHWGRDISILRKRLNCGKCFTQPYLGQREFIACFRPWTGGEPVPAYPDLTLQLGLMPFHTREDSADGTFYTSFFNADLINGVLKVAGCEVLRDDPA